MVLNRYTEQWRRMTKYRDSRNDGGSKNLLSPINCDLLKNTERQIMLLDEYAEQWDLMAKYWDSRNDWGNEYLLLPTMFELLGNIRGLDIIDIGCATGQLARNFSRLGANVVGVDISQEMLRIAKEHELDFFTGANYILTDATNLAKSINGQFDIAVANMTIQSIDNYQSVFSEVKGILKPMGFFVFSIEHPFFALGRKHHFLTKRKWEDCKSEEKSKDLSYFRTYKQQVQWPNGRITYHFFRSLSAYVTTLAEQNFSILQIKEPEPTADAREKNLEQYKVFTTLPRFLVFKCGLLGNSEE